MLQLKYLRFWQVTSWIAVIVALIFCLLPSKALSHLPQLNDKIEHAWGYAILTLWFCGLYPRQKYWRIVVGLLLMGAGVEIAQSMMHLGREGDVRDLAANSVGIVLGLILSMTVLGRWAFWFEARCTALRDVMRNT